MTTSSASRGRITVMEVEQFLRKPPEGFSVRSLGWGRRVRSDPEKSLVLIDDFKLGDGKVVFENSKGRKFVMHDLWEYTSMRKTLLSKSICLLVSACADKRAAANKNAAAKARVPALKRCVVFIDGNDPFIRWQLEKLLDRTISSVIGENYTVDIDLSDALESWAKENTPVVADGQVNLRPLWRDASFTLKYHSDAFFDFPYWFGFSKRTFKLRLT